MNTVYNPSDERIDNNTTVLVKGRIVTTSRHARLVSIDNIELWIPNSQHQVKGLNILITEWFFNKYINK